MKQTNISIFITCWVLALSLCGCVMMNQDVDNVGDKGNRLAVGDRFVTTEVCYLLLQNHHRSRGWQSA